MKFLIIHSQHVATEYNGFVPQTVVRKQIGTDIILYIYLFSFTIKIMRQVKIRVTVCLSVCRDKYPNKYIKSFSFTERWYL